uniref:Uncharacterized protein n=1 Tax=Leptocylindrus danicus TaxID=163516 RepID=A0A7S2P9D4_9STRA|mmetsp:Transcript_26091/g.38890  ORF Transcript_26091/g.38890 Transcript_26091/m.38890 type:complete len:438 (+) Transcript_26091:164-1477(+)|eukprot:CAMPEP_0116018980 /NCGR_PEP_ID=MMETSP0321-20121206/8962_1 /TAXON_ID=163516 /ORGANISM="Leptocylindrus danicus var. danicus, Strain B650" /LENGTH=437 /DNA_ID=CAMNT_0003489459 /DNA_START=155 /DNA_END=1468 /DNA_ORIENTATION=-
MDVQEKSSVQYSKNGDGFNIQSQIDYEERDIKRLEIEISLRKRQRDRDSSVMLAEVNVPVQKIQCMNKASDYSDSSVMKHDVQHDQKAQHHFFNDSIELLDALDALASRSGEAVSLSMSLLTPGTQQLKQDHRQQQRDHTTAIDPDILRLQAQISGICFSAIKSVSNGPENVRVIDDDDDDREVKRTYELCGFVYGKSRSNFRFRVVANISIVNRTLKRPLDHDGKSSVGGEETRGVVEGLNVTFFDSNSGTELNNSTQTQLFPKDELDELSRHAQYSKNLPRLFQDLVKFASFDYRRWMVLSNIGKNYAKEHFTLLSAASFRISSICERHEAVHPFFMELKWQWEFSHLTIGGEELVLDSTSDVFRTSTPKASCELSRLLNELDELGLDSLVESVGFEEAIIILLKALGPQQVKKRRATFSTSKCTILEIMSPPPK